MLKLTLIKSLNGRNTTHIATAKSLGLKRIGNTAEQPDNEATRGKLAQIRYLVRVEEETK
jgi:large subunit ribosomal protein L30